MRGLALTFLVLLGLVLSLFLDSLDLLPVAAKIPDSEFKVETVAQEQLHFSQHLLAENRDEGAIREHTVSANRLPSQAKADNSPIQNPKSKIQNGMLPAIPPSLSADRQGFETSHEDSEEQEGRAYYEAGEFAAAITAWQQAAQAYQGMGNRRSQARVLSNLSLAYQQLGQWELATQAIAESLKLLQRESKEDLPVLAQALNTQGSLQFALGQPEQALESWQEAEEAYAQAGMAGGVLRSQINQVQAMESLGLYRRALKLLETVNQTLKTQPDSQLKALTSRKLGRLLRLVGDYQQAQQLLEQSLAIARQLHQGDDLAAALLSLGNLARADRQQQAKALQFYQEAAVACQDSQLCSSTDRLSSIQLAQLSLLLETQQWQAAAALLPQIQGNLNNLPPSHSTLYAKINFADRLIRLKQGSGGEETGGRGEIFPSLPSWKAIAQLLATTVQQARDLGDRRALAYALCNLGQVYEQTQQRSIAQELNEQALVVAQSIQAPEISYQCLWRLGRLWAAQGNRSKAIAAYSEAVKLLQSLSGDLVAIAPEAQFSFRESVEPIYRELVSLLLQPGRDGQVSQDDLKAARSVMESLQVAELNNFFRQACLDAKPVSVDEIVNQVDKQAAVIYPIILRDRLEAILTLPGQPLAHYATPIPAKEMGSAIEQLRQTLVIRSQREFFAPAQKLYDWLIRPMVGDLAKQGIETLVFVPDGPLRNVPMAVLHDGKQYLIEQYRIAITPGLQLLEPHPLHQGQLKILAAGLSEGRGDFPPLKYVPLELEDIKANLSGTVLLNQAFTKEALAEDIEFSTFPVVHIATHGQFSSNLAETFILAWDGPINLGELERLLKGRVPRQEAAIELLVLSACETAAGDDRAALGLAGIAVRAGARSTLGTLWAVNDQTAATLVNQFYQVLVKQEATKAEALRQAQLKVLQSRWDRHPFYWAPYVLVGNWL